MYIFNSDKWWKIEICDQSTIILWKIVCNEDEIIFLLFNLKSMLLSIGPISLNGCRQIVWLSALSSGGCGYRMVYFSIPLRIKICITLSKPQRLDDLMIFLGFGHRLSD